MKNDTDYRPLHAVNIMAQDISRPQVKVKLTTQSPTPRDRAGPIKTQAAYGVSNATTGR